MKYTLLIEELDEGFAVSVPGLPLAGRNEGGSTGEHRRRYPRIPGCGAGTCSIGGSQAVNAIAMGNIVAMSLA